MKIVISRYAEDLSWIKDYKFDYTIYNKGNPLDDLYSISKPNIGNNQRDIFEYIEDNYENLPEVITFLQGNPFDHCKKEKFDKIINNKFFTPIESCELDFIKNDCCMLDTNNGYMELNNNWYIYMHNNTYNISCKYPSFDSFMYETFKDYTHLDWIRFTPGSQYIVTKESILYYPKEFWKYLKDILIRNSMTEGHILERSLWYIFNNKYQSRIH
jgi:hypothetical protein